MNMWLRLLRGSLFCVEFILTDLVGEKKLLGSSSKVLSSSSLKLSAVLGLKSFSSTVWVSKRRPFISDVISSLKEALILSKMLSSILGDLGLDGPVTTSSCSMTSTFLTETGQTNVSLTFSAGSCCAFFLF